MRTNYELLRNERDQHKSASEQLSIQQQELTTQL